MEEIPKELKEISPLWYERLTKEDKLQLQKPKEVKKHLIFKYLLSLGNAETCVVGEAWGFDDSYYETYNKKRCLDCYHHSIGIYDNYFDKSNDLTNNSINSFIKHFKEVHRKNV